MNGKELKGHPGRYLKVDFDVKQKAKTTTTTQKCKYGELPEVFRKFYIEKSMILV